MATTVDSLEVKISTTIGDCNQKLDRLISKLSHVSKALKSIQDGEVFEPFTNEVKKAEGSSDKIKNASKKIVQSYDEIKQASEKLVKASRDKANDFIGNNSGVEKLRQQIRTITNAYDTARVNLAKIDVTEGTSKSYVKATKNVIAYEEELKVLKARLEEVEARNNASAKKINESYTNDKNSSFEKEQEYLDSISRKAEESAQSIRDMSDNASNLASNMQDVSTPMTTWSDVLGGLRNTMDAVGYSAKVFADNVIDSMRGMKPSTEDWKYSLTELQFGFSELMFTAMDTFSAIKNTDVKGVFESIGNKASEIGDNIRKSIGNALDYLVEKGARLKTALSEGLVSKGVLTYTEQYATLRKDIDKTRQELDKLEYEKARYLATGGEDTDTTFLKYAYDIQHASIELKKFQDLEIGLQEKHKTLQVSNKALYGAFKDIGKFGNEFTKTFEKTFGIIGKIGNAVGNAVGKFHLFDKVTKSAKKSTDKFNLSNINLAKSLFKTTKMLKLMIVRMALRKVISGVTDGFKNLAQYSDKVNASMSLLWNSLRQLGNSIASAVSPLLNAFAPALNKIIQLLITATNYINQFISSIAGLQTWTKAKLLTDSYAESLDKTGKSAKKLKNQLQSFDALNNLTTQDKDTGTQPKDMFEEMQVDEKVKEIADKFKKLWADLIAPLKKAWNNIGSFIVDSFKGTADKLKKLFAQIGKDFMEVWGEWKTQKMFENILLIIGRIVRIVGILADKIREAWKYNNNGLRILRSIRDVLYTIVQWILNAVEYTQSWVNHLDLKPLFTAIAGYMETLDRIVQNIMKVLYGFYTMVLLKFSKWTLEKGLPQFFDIMKKFNLEVNWENLTDRINKIWTALEPFAEKVGQGLIDFFDYLMDKLREFLNSDLLNSILDNIKGFFDFLTNLDWEIDTSALDESFTKYLESLAPVVTEVRGIIEDFIEYALKPIAQWVVGEGLPLFLDTLTKLNESGIITTIRNTLKDLYDVLIPFAEKIGEGLIIFMGDVAEKLNEFFKSDAWEWFIETLKDWTQNVKAEEIAKGLELVCGAFLGFKALAMVTGVLKIVTSFLGFLKDFGIIIAKAIEGVAKAVLFLKNSISTVIGVMSSPQWMSFAELLSNPMSVVGISKIIDAIRGTWLDPDEWKGIFGKIFDYFGIFWNDLWASIPKGIDELFGTNLLGKMGFKWETFDEYNQAVDKLKNAGKDIGGTYDEIVSRANNLSQTTTNNVKGALSSVLDYSNKLSESANDTKNKVEDNSAKIKGSLASVLDSSNKLTIHVKDNSKEYIKATETNATTTKKAKDDIKISFEAIENSVAHCQTELKASFTEIQKDNKTTTDNIGKELNKFKDTHLSEEAWTFNGIEDGLKKSFRNAFEGVKEVWNDFAKWMNERAEIEIEPLEIDGKKINGGGKSKMFHIPAYATGGFVEDGMFMMNHNEMVGRFNNGKTAVANNEQIIQGIAQGVASANSQQNGLLRQQNELLQKILEKETGISSDDLFRSVQRSANTYYQKTGRYAF